MLSHRNILSNVDSVARIFSLDHSDRILGVIPFFHAFGFTMALWFPLLLGLAAVYHSNPLDAKTIGKMSLQHKPTILCSTPTFYSAYLRHCSAAQFSSLRFAMTGAEKLRETMAREFKAKFGLDLIEGYGCTEMGPVVSVNLPNPPSGNPGAGFRTGTVGRPIPGVSVRMVDPLTGNDLPAGEQGLLLARGPSQMMGYLGQPEESAKVLRDGWYVTGDIAAVDEDGFIAISDRLSRFSKIGGEMVPHLKIEETVNQILGDGGCVVTAIPDEQKGERLAAFYTQTQIAPEELWNRLKRTHLPKLWIPKKDDIHWIDSIPLLGSGKIDLKRIKTMALEMAGR